MERGESAEEDGQWKVRGELMGDEDFCGTRERSHCFLNLSIHNVLIMGNGHDIYRQLQDIILLSLLGTFIMSFIHNYSRRALALLKVKFCTHW